MTEQATLGEAILSTKAGAARYFAGFDDTNHTAQAPSLPNHLAWTLGHLALTMHRTAEKFDGKPMPEADIRAGEPQRPVRAFSVEDVAFGSAPTADPSRYPSLARCIEIYNNACDRIAGAIRALPDARLAESHPWGRTTLTLREMASRMVFHNGMHTGQIADLRRALNMKSIFA